MQQNDNYLTKIGICDCFIVFLSMQDFSYPDIYHTGYLNKTTVCRNKFKPEKQEIITNEHLKLQQYNKINE